MIKKLRVPRPLFIIASILIVSAIVRLPLIASEAFALDENTSKSGMEGLPLQTSAGLDVLLQEMQTRERRIEEREAGLDAKAEKLAAFSTEVSAKIKELENAETQLRSVLQIADSAAQDDVTRLTTVYENMKPKDAAAVFEQMQPAFAAGFLAQMRADAAASIMAGLSPGKAYAVSVVLAGRHVESSNQ